MNGIASSAARGRSSGPARHHRLRRPALPDGQTDPNTDKNTAFRDIGTLMDAVSAERADHGAKLQEQDRPSWDSFDRLFPEGRLAGARLEQPP